MTREIESDAILESINDFENKLMVALAVKAKQKTINNLNKTIRLIHDVFILLRQEYILADDEAHFASMIKFILRLKNLDKPSLWEGFISKDMNAKDVCQFLSGEFYDFLDAPDKYSMGMMSDPKPAENELEDAINWVDGTKFDGSEKQIKWAKDIAHKNLEYICRLWKENKVPSTSAKWWIENRNDI